MNANVSETVEIFLGSKLSIVLLTFIIPALRIQVVNHPDGEKVKVTKTKPDLQTPE